MLRRCGWVLAVLLGLTLTSSAQKLLTESEVKVQRFGKQSLYMLEGSKERLDGHYKIADSRGNYIDLHFKDGQRDGLFRSYDWKDRLLSEVHYKEGEKVGEYKSFHQNGKLSREGQYKHGAQDGEWNYYDDEGKRITVEHYAEGKKTGEWWKLLTVSTGGGAGGWWVFFFELNPGYDEAAGGTVKVEEVEHYKDGQLHGKAWQKVVDGPVRWERDYEDDGTYSSKEFYPNGKLELVKHLKNHKLDGKRLNYSRAGVLLGERVFKDDVLEQETVYWESGKPHYQKHYLHAQLDGEYREWNEKGELLVEGEYKGGSKTGLWKRYIPEEERLGNEIHYEGGEPNGKAKFYNAANRVELEGQYKNGEQDGLWKRYDLAGKLKEEMEYDMGREVSKKEYK